MKLNSKNIIITMCTVLFIINGASAAINLFTGDNVPGGINYNFRAIIDDQGGNASQSGNVGAWSWEDQSLFSPGQDPVGWTHTSRWFALTVQGPISLTLTLERDPNVLNTTNNTLYPVNDFFPSLTLYSGLDNDLMPASAAATLNLNPATANDTHTYNNDGDIFWAEDITYLDHYSNNVLETITRTWTLSAGQYSLVVGSNAPSETNPPRQGFKATFSAVPIPEPSLSILSVLGLSTLMRRRRNY